MIHGNVAGHNYHQQNLGEEGDIFIGGLPNIDSIYMSVSVTSCTLDFPDLVPDTGIDLDVAPLLLATSPPAAVLLLIVVFHHEVKCVHRPGHHLHGVVIVVLILIKTYLLFEIFNFNNFSKTFCIISSLKLGHSKVDDLLVDLSRHRTSHTGRSCSSL